MTQRALFTSLLATFLLASTAAAAQEIKNTSFGLPDGTRVLRHEGVVAAPLEDVWKTFTTADGLRTFLAPVVALDFRIGGKWEVSSDPKGRLGDANNIVNEVISFLPLEMISVRVVQTPANFSDPDVAKSVWTVYQFESQAADRTRVIVSMAGWKSGAAWDRVYAFFERGNAYTMGQLQRRFTEGPRRWD